MQKRGRGSEGLMMGRLTNPRSLRQLCVDFIVARGLHKPNHSQGNAPVNLSPSQLLLLQGLLRELEEEALLAGIANPNHQPSAELSNSQHRLVYKIALIGDDCVGKTCLCDTWRDGQYPDESIHQCTLGAAWFAHTVETDNGTVKLEVWDTAGQIRFDQLTSMYYEEADGIIVVYEVSSRDSFEKMKYWVSQIKAGPNYKAVIYVVASKVDLMKKNKLSFVPHEEAQEFVQANGLEAWMAVSAKQNYNVQELFASITKSLIEHDKAKNIKRILKYISAEPDNKGGITVQYKPSETIEVGGHWNRLLCLPWQPDSSSPMCTRCHKPFTITKRRHHCRRCGRLFCAKCSSCRVVLPRDIDAASSAQARGMPVRVCEHCQDMLQSYMSTRQHCP